MVYPQLTIAANGDNGQNTGTTKTGLGQWEDKLKNAGGPAGYDTQTENEETPLLEMIGKIIKYILSFLGVIFLILMIYGGFLWMTAHGNEEQVKKAKALITNATIGLAIILAAYAITWFVVDRIVNATGYEL